MWPKTYRIRRRVLHVCDEARVFADIAMRCAAWRQHESVDPVVGLDIGIDAG